MDWIALKDDQNRLNSADADTIIILFETGKIRRFSEDWPHEVATHFLIIPEPPVKF